MTPAGNHGKKNGGKSVQTLVGIDERRGRVATMLVAHTKYREMARRENVSVSVIANDVKMIRRQWQQDFADSYDTLVHAETAKLDMIEGRLLHRALTGGKDGGMDLWALDRLFVLMERRARMLGLDAPQRVEVQMRVELIAKAIEEVVVTLGVDPDKVRPLLGTKLREFAAITSKN